MERDYLLALPKAPMELHPLLSPRRWILRGGILERSGEGIYVLLDPQKSKAILSRITNKQVSLSILSNEYRLASLNPPRTLAMYRFTTLALALLPSIISAQRPIPCNSEADCPTDTNTTCVIPSNGPGTCLPSCTLTSDARPCELGQRCDALPQISTMQIGYCPEPATCGGFIGAACKDDRNPICIDDPRDDCDPKNGGADCGGICVATTKTPTPPTDQSCGGL